ncbi:two-component system, OmpR family, sensor kinase domain protein, partial [Helicobacter pylori Hp P-4d]
PPPPKNLREVSGMKGTGKANCGVKEKQKERTCSND